MHDTTPWLDIDIHRDFSVGGGWAKQDLIRNNGKHNRIDQNTIEDFQTRLDMLGDIDTPWF